MFIRGKNISISFLSVFIILITVLLSSVGVTNSWFTGNVKNGIRVDVVVASLDLQLYQTIDSKETKILTTVKNNEAETDGNNTTNPQYLVFSGALLPDEYVPITLTLKNEDVGSSSMYVRFKFELYRRTINGDVLVPIEITPGGIADGKSGGFGIKTGDSSGYFYYQNSSQENSVFNTGENAVLLTQFRVPTSSFVDENGNMKLVNSDTCYIRITIEASIYQNFTNA